MTGTAAATAFAPASIGNVGVGFDMLGLAISGVGDRVTARRTTAPGVRVAGIYDAEGAPHPGLSRDAASNTASIAAAALWRATSAAGGLEIEICKGIPLQSGMGSSAASAVAAAVATNALLDTPLPRHDLLRFALEGERFASGGLHADNVAPCLFGGLVLCPPRLLPACLSLSVPEGVSSVLVHPELRIDTAASRRALARSIGMDQWLAQQGFLAVFVAACERGDTALMRRSLEDVVIEPQRAASVPCFAAVKAAALETGAFGCSLSGSGPSIFALCAAAAAPKIAAAMKEACRRAGPACESWISPMNAPGARLEESP